VMIRNFLVGSLVIDSRLQSSSRGALLKIGFVTGGGGAPLRTQRNRRYLRTSGHITGRAR
jgi:hypothetical protein